MFFDIQLKLGFKKVLLWFNNQNIKFYEQWTSPNTVLTVGIFQVSNVVSILVHALFAFQTSQLAPLFVYEFILSFCFLSYSCGSITL